ncbi:EAF domain-containing protein [Mycena venus]|uniref:EAF domain-containing protein n=1 Tax=Mycena venus TaxID=2733690 RepID=A0A8H6WYC4_9AGAR|nr:EAF domain-containing protein [Mycena venus]
MAPTEDNSWIPQGTHEVQIGPSLNKALKARKGGPPPQVKRTGPPEKDFYSFRYNRKPPSLDTTKPGTIELSRGKDTTTVVVEHPSSQPGESHVYTGTDTSAKELDCVLIYDEETGSYKLEKLESYIGLNYERKTTASLPHSTASTPAKIDTDTEETRLSLELDAVGEIDDELPSHFPPMREEEEEEEEDLEPVPVLPPPPPPPVVKPVKAPPAPKPVVASTSRPTKPAPQRKSTTKKAAPPPAPPPPVPLDADGDADEEIIEFGRPTVKRARPQPPPPAPAPAPAPVAFSLPGSSSGWVPPPAPHTTSRSAPPPAPPSPVAVADDSDEDDDWDEVAAAPIVADAQPQEIDMNEFEMTLEAEMEDADDDGDGDVFGSEPEEDFLADVLPQAPDSSSGAPVRAPMSISQLAAAQGFSDDEYSSSEESDDD